MPCLLLSLLYIISHFSSIVIPVRGQGRTVPYYGYSVFEEVSVVILEMIFLICKLIMSLPFMERPYQYRLAWELQVFIVNFPNMEMTDV